MNLRIRKSMYCVRCLRRRFNTTAFLCAGNSSPNKIRNNKLSDAEQAKQIILSQLENNFDIPKQKSWSSTAMLETLNKSTANAALPKYGIYTNMLWGIPEKYAVGNKKSLMAGEQTAEYIIKQHSELFKFGWDADNPDIWLQPKHEELTILEADCDEKEVKEEFLETSIKSLQTLVDQKKVKQSINMFFQLRKDNVDIPDEVFNHFFAFIAFYRANHEEIEGFSFSPSMILYRLPSRVTMTVLDKIFNTIKNPTKEQISVMMKSYNTNQQSAEVISLYKKHFQNKGVSLSLDTLNNIIFAARFSDHFHKKKLIMEVLHLMKSQNISPNYDTYHSLIQNYFSFGLKDAFFDVILDHMNEMGLEPCISTYAKIFMVVSTPTSHKVSDSTLVPLMHKYIDRIANTEFTYKYYKDIGAFSQMMRCSKNDPSLAHKVYDLFVYGQNYSLSRCNLEHMHLYNHYLDCVLTHGPTMEDVYKIWCKLIPLKSPMTWHRKNMLLGCVKRYKAPEYLPILISDVLLPRIWNKSIHQYMGAGVLLYELADEKTVTQLKNIALLVINLVHNDSIGQIVNYSDLISDCIVLLGRAPTDLGMLQKGMQLVPELKPSFLHQEAKNYCDAHVKENDFASLKNLLRNIEVSDPKNAGNTWNAEKKYVDGDESIYPYNYIQMDVKDKWKSRNRKRRPNYS